MEIWLPSNIVDRVVCAHPPCQERGEDKVFWKPSSDGWFSVKSAYLFLVSGSRRSGDSIWKLLWRWGVPDKIKTFMWLTIHGRLHTAQLRASRGISSEDFCPYGCGQQEDVMHLLRDCPNARMCWEKLISPSKKSSFFLKQEVEWIRWNLSHDIGEPFTGKVPWSTLFGYVCWDIWVARCKRLFGDAIGEDHCNPNHSFFRASSDMDVLRRCNASKGQRYTNEGRVFSDGEYVTLIVDGSVLADGRSGCGGFIQGDQLEWITGFSCKLTQVPPVIAELIAFIHGLTICWSKGFKKVVLISDCIEAINFAIRGCADHFPFKDVVDDVRLLLHRDWQVVITFEGRNNITTADQIAKFSHLMSGNFCVFDECPLFLNQEGVDVG